MRTVCAMHRNPGAPTYPISELSGSKSNNVMVLGLGPSTIGIWTLREWKILEYHDMWAVGNEGPHNNTEEIDIEFRQSILYGNYI